MKEMCKQEFPKITEDYSFYLGQSAVILPDGDKKQGSKPEKTDGKKRDKTFLFRRNKLFDIKTEGGQRLPSL